MAVSGTNTRDRKCASCSLGSEFSDDINAVACKPLTNCEPGTYILNNIQDARSDRQCELPDRGSPLHAASHARSRVLLTKHLSAFTLAQVRSVLRGCSRPCLIASVNDGPIATKGEEVVWCSTVANRRQR